MPGREDLIQQNISNARVKAAEPRPQESVGKSSSGALATGGPKSFFGGNYEVYSALESVKFQGKYGDGSMRGNVAYIRIWKRGGTVNQTGATGSEAGSNDTDLWSALGISLEERFGSEGSFIKYNPETTSYTVSDWALNFFRNVQRDEDGNIISGFQETFFVGAQNTQRQTAISSQTPSNRSTEQRPGIVVGPSPFSPRPATSPYLQSPRSLGSTPIFAPSQPLGPVVPGNPNGLVTLLGNIGIAASLGGLGFRGSYPSYLQGPRLPRPLYQGGGNASKLNKTIYPTAEMMWQFLFNPSELELDVGPEFKNAETWGVSDKANSGQPLHWSHNKNAQLKFNSVLLNGFVFGRKVEALEQGLFELFMKRDGEGQHGPHILEFVWGKRTFGPCVIKNINIKEKMWDEGELVNAEVSFTLEQVPEWTINDGAYVDVARPGRRPTQEDPLEPQQQQSGTENESLPENKPPGGGSSPAQKPPTAAPAPSAQFCTQATNAYSNFNNLGKKSNKSWTDNIFGTPEARAAQLGTEYSTILNANRSIIGATGGIDTKCTKGCPQKDYYFPNTATLKVNEYVGCIQSCSYQVASKIQGSYLDDKSCLKPQFITPR